MKTEYTLPARSPTLLASLLLVCSIANATDGTSQPDLTGIWKLDKPISALKTTAGETPPLLPEAASKYAALRAAYQSGDRSFDVSEKTCLSPGIPRLLQLAYPFQIIQRPRQLTMLFQWNNRFRMIDLSGAPIAVDDLAYMGTSGGHWDGSVLVIETIGFVETTFLDASGLPHSESLRLTERYQLKNGGRTLVNDITIDDPKTFTLPWVATLTYKRMPASMEISEDVCRERVAAGKSAFARSGPD